MRISGIAVVSSIAIPELVSLSSFEFQVSHNTNATRHLVVATDVITTLHLSLQEALFVGSCNVVKSHRTATGQNNHLSKSLTSHD